jgi:hypothetical protein
MFSCFRKTTSPDSRDLERLIFDIAERQADQDLHLLYRRMADRVVFVPVDADTIPESAVPGEPYVVKPGERLAMRFVTGPNDWRLVPAATQDTAVLLKQGFVGMAWFDFLRMVNGLDSLIQGALLQGTTSWVAFDRERIRYILERSGA